MATLYIGAADLVDIAHVEGLDEELAARPEVVYIYWTGSSWPTRASSIPVGYTGAVIYDSTTDIAASAPSDDVIGDRWFKASSGGSAGATWTEVEIDFGTTPQYSTTFTITDAAVSSTSKVAVTSSGKIATGRAGDDWAWDAIMFSALPGTGNFTLTAFALPGPVAGKRKIQYQIG
jgi:hypothetical protein